MGGFVVRLCVAAASTCIGALKTKKPVLCQLNRNDDMQAHNPPRPRAEKEAHLKLGV